MLNNYESRDKFNTEKNVDRTRFFKDNLSLQACYHLENGKKSGIIYINEITCDNKFNLNTKKYFDYGILDIKFDDKCIYTSNSDSSFSILSHSLDEEFNYKVSDYLDNTCNTLDKNGDLMLLAMNDGHHHIYDINTKSLISSIKSHEYGLWSIYWYNEQTYFTGSEDSILKSWDIREKE
jgi:hypothetical protein